MASSAPLQPQQPEQRATASASDEPTGLVANSGIELLTAPTSNGLKVSILLEELKDAYGLDYTYQSISIWKNTQKQPWFVALNPNGRIPVVVDHNRGGFAVFEGLAILAYLTRHYDPDHRFSFPVDSDDYSVAEQWMAWQHAAIGPMQGQAHHFVRFSKERIPYAAQRYVGEIERLYGVLEARLAAGRDWVAGPGRGRYSIADMCLAGWADTAGASGASMDRFPHVDAWLARLKARPATARGFCVPKASSFSREAIAAATPEDRAGEAERKKFVAEAQAKYGYKYTSP